MEGAVGGTTAFGARHNMSTVHVCSIGSDRRTDAASRAAVARQRIEALKNGAAVSGGLSKPASPADLFRAAGFSDAELAH